MCTVIPESRGPENVWLEERWQKGRRREHPKLSVFNLTAFFLSSFSVMFSIMSLSPIVILFLFFPLAALLLISSLQAYSPIPGGLCHFGVLIPHVSVLTHVI